MNNLNLISNFAEFKELKNIDKSIMIEVLEDVFRHALQKQYGTDENFDVIINADKGDLEIWRNRVVVADEDFDTCDAFYLTHMGFSSDRSAADAGKDARYYKLNSDRLKAIRCSEKVAVPLVHVAFIVEDCEATKTYLESHGILCGDVHICERCGSRVMKVEGPDKEKLIFAEKI